MSGPAGTGKSRACLEKLHLLCKKYPGMRGLILRKVLSSLGSTGLVTWRTYVIDQDLLSGEVTYYGGSQEEPAQYRYRNGSTVVIGGLDKSIKIMSSEYDVVYVQEATELTEDDWEMVTTRMRNGRMPYQQMLADANPNAPTHWLKQRCDRGDCVMLHSRHEENPVLFDEIRGDGGIVEYKMTERGRAYMSILDRLTGVRRLRLRDGKWVAAEGVIFEAFDESTHVIDRYQQWGETGLPPADWMRWWVVDFGHTNPFVCQMWAEDGDGNLYLYREIYRTRRTVVEHAHDIMALVSEPDPHHVGDRGDVASSGRIWTEPKPRAILCDHDALGRAELRKQLNVGTRPADKAVGVGIELAQERFKHGRIFLCRDALAHPPDPELVAVKRPTCTLEEIPSYVWEPPAPGRPPKETPVKDNDHGCDCIRYLAKHRSIGSARVRILNG